MSLRKQCKAETMWLLTFTNAENVQRWEHSNLPTRPDKNIAQCLRLTVIETAVSSVTDYLSEQKHTVLEQ